MDKNRANLKRLYTATKRTEGMIDRELAGKLDSYKSVKDKGALYKIVPDEADEWVQRGQRWNNGDKHPRKG